MYNVHTTHPLIPREQNYILDRKLITIHSEDRDIKKWPTSNLFEVCLPISMDNVQSMRLVECNLPINYNTFSNDYQNTKMSFTLQPQDPTDAYYTVLNDVSNIPFTITIQDGFYCPDKLASELQNKLNDVLTDYIMSESVMSTYENMRVLYDSVGQKFWFGNVKDQVTLLFANQESYTLNNCKQPDMWNKYVKWGLPSYLGFNKETYIMQPALNSSDVPIPIKFAYLGTSQIWISPESAVLPVYSTTAPASPILFGERTIYMEIDKYNSYDELKPFSEATNNLYNNDYNGFVDYAFAKIPIFNNPLGDMVDSRNGFLQNITHFDIPEEKISKLKFKFRYHDGRLVEFGNIPFDFTIEFNRLKNEIPRKYNIRIPATYRL